MARLSLALLGPLRIALDGQPVSGFAYNKARALLIYLAAESDRAHQRDALVGLLWPDLPDTIARINLRQVLTNLRAAIDDSSATPLFLLITRDTIQFNSSSDNKLDIISFTTLLDACATHGHRHLDRCRSCAARMEQAISLYRGDFLAEFALGDSAAFDEWALRHREQLHQRALDALAHLADYHERRGDDEPARRYAQRQIELDPWREEAHCQLMRLLARGGQRSAALAQYQTCRRVLARDLGVEPAAETTELYEQIRDGELKIENEQLKNTATERFSIFNSQFSISRHNFPAQTTPLIGRETELADLGDLLENPARRLITITGPGGIGKTRLALAAATEQTQVFADGAAFVPLAAISAAEFVAPAIMAALDLALQSQRNPHDQLLDYLRAKELLIVLDNFEQLLGPGVSQNNSAADLLTDILQHAPGITLVITSRERLALQGEWLFDLPGLSYPTGKLVDDIESYSSAQLFLQRAGQVRRHFALAEGEANAVAHICRLVEGLPLAIELAAAALRVRTCASIADAIETNLSALTTVLRSISERHRSIWATFEYSWGLLSDEERLVFPRLAVFRGGFTLEAATAVQSSKFKVQSSELNTAELLTQNSELLTLLAALVDKSLLRWDGAARYDMHELVRQYAGEKLEQEGETERIRRQHAAYFLTLAEEAEPKLHGADQTIWFNRLEIEHDNLRAVLAWHTATPDNVAIRLRLASALAWFWLVRGYGNEGLNRLTSLLSQGGSEQPTTWRAKALNAAGLFSLTFDNDATAEEYYQESLKISTALEDKLNKAHALRGMGTVARVQCDPAHACSAFEESLALFRVLGDSWGIGSTLVDLGVVSMVRGDARCAKMCCEESLAIHRKQGDRQGVARALRQMGALMIDQDDNCARALFEESLLLYRELGIAGGIASLLNLLGEVARKQGDYERAATLYEESLTLQQELGEPGSIAGILHNLAYVALHKNDYDRGAALFAESLGLYRKIGDLNGIVICLAGMAGMASARSHPERAACLFGAHEMLLEVSDMRIDPIDRIEYDRNLAAIRAQLDDAAFAAAWAAGRALTLEQAVAEALSNDASA